MTNDEPWHTAARVEQKRRLDLQLTDYKAALGNCTLYEAFRDGGLVAGSIHDMQEYGLLEPAEVAEYLAQLLNAYAETQPLPADLELFDHLWMWDPLEPTP